LVSLSDPDFFNMRAKYGRVHKVVNGEKKFGSNSSYNYVRLKMAGGEEANLLLTDSQVHTAQDRARKNPEDCDVEVSLKEWLKR